MRSTALLISLLVVAAAAAPAPAQVPPLAVKVSACATGAEPAERFVEFTASMPREGAAIMGMRFVLYEKLRGAERFVRVSLPNWEEWERSGAARVPGFVFTKRVEQLAAPAAFRAVVTFRWYDDEGAVVRTTRRTTPVCRQPDPRADLAVERLRLTEKGRVQVTVVNRGRAAAPAFDVTMAHSDVVASRLEDPLGAGERRILTLGRCTASEEASVRLDADGRVDEAREDNNTATIACPRASA